MSQLYQRRRCQVERLRFPSLARGGGTRDVSFAPDAPPVLLFEPK
jgi:hypothetical protein